MDGTLYRQRPLRLRMARDLLLHAARKRDRTALRVLGAYRRLRERLGDAETPDFEPALVAQTAAATKTPPELVRNLVAEWIDRRPLAYLAPCRYPGLDALFAALRRHGKTIAVLSDYPARDKLAALGLTADIVVSATDPGVARLKPHPHGLQLLLRQAGVAPSAAVLIGDRASRDGQCARRAGVHALLRASSPLEGWQTFARYDDPIFAPLLISCPKAADDPLGSGPGARARTARQGVVRVQPDPVRRPPGA